MFEVTGLEEGEGSKASDCKANWQKHVSKMHQELYNWRDDLSGILPGTPLGCQADFLYKLSIILEGFSILELINYLSVSGDSKQK